MPSPNLAVITSGFVAANVVEALLWFLVAGIVFYRFRSAAGAVLLVAFGISDLVETQTGAWWRPWWLLVWKAACIAGLLTLLVLAWRNKKAGAPEEERAPAAEEV